MKKRPFKKATKKQRQAWWKSLTPEEQEKYIAKKQKITVEQLRDKPVMRELSWLIDGNE